MNLGGPLLTKLRGYWLMFSGGVSMPERGILEARGGLRAVDDPINGHTALELDPEAPLVPTVPVDFNGQALTDVGSIQLGPLFFDDATLVTTDATPTLIYTVPIPLNSGVSVRFKLIGRNPGTALCVVERRVDLHREAGAFTLDSLSPQIVGADAVAKDGFVPAPVTGTTDATASGLYGGGGTLDGLTLIGDQGAGNLTLTLSGTGNAANGTAFLAAIGAKWPNWVASFGGAGGNKLVLTSSVQGAGSLIGIHGGTANAALGLTNPTVHAGVDGSGLDSPGASTTALQIRVRGVAGASVRWTLAIEIITNT